MDNDKVSVIIATYNRFDYLMNTIQSVKEQTYQNIEIIVINDCSTQPEYYTYDFKTNGVIIIHLDQNSKQIHGFACPGGYQRNFGIKISTGKYIAFCDDDDIWFPDKLKLQISRMKETGCSMSSTEALIGTGVYDPKNEYKKYISEFSKYWLIDTYKKHNIDFFIDDLPIFIWDLNLLRINNCCICSSVVIEKSIIDKTGFFESMPTADDYEYWLRVIEHTNCIYIHIPCVYYDFGHGDGQNYYTNGL